MDQMLGDAFQILAFRDLERPHQLAMAHYMAIDGEAWAQCLPAGASWPSRQQQQRGIRRCLPRMVELYGGTLFGVALLPRESLQQAILQSKEIGGDFPDWDAYHAWYVNAGDMPNHGTKNRWPVILSDLGDEVLQDGWHRLHCYLKRGDADIPAVFYPREHHLQQAGLA